MIEALITGGVSLLSSLFGGKKKQTTTNRVNYKQMVQDAEAAGFNPLTALRNGGSANSTSTTTNSMSAMTAVGEALEAGVSTYLASNPFDSAEKRREQMLFDAQLEGLRLDNSMKQRAFRTPVKSGDQAIAALPSLGAKNPNNKMPIGSKLLSGNTLGAPQNFTEGRGVTVTNPLKYGRVNPNVADAEAMETRYGDIVQNVYGVGVAAADLKENLLPKQKTWDEVLKKNAEIRAKGTLERAKQREKHLATRAYLKKHGHKLGL